LRGIPYQQHRRLTVIYKGKEVGYYEADIVVDDKIILELKAVSRFHASHTAQAIHYLKATGLRLAILFNFGAKSLQKKRLVR
jgi:GxxExxY protein